MAMATIRTSKGEKITVDAEDHPILSRHKWFFDGKRIQCHLANGEAGRCTHSMSRLIMGPPGFGYVWDHKDNDPFNNRKSNFRRATHGQNRANTKKQNRFRGVTASTCKNRPWKSQITVNGRTKFLGNFATQKEAAKMYDVAALEFNGEFACLNYPLIL